MDLLGQIKRKRGEMFSLGKCIFCQECRDESTRKATEQGFNSVKDAMYKRIKYNCDKYLDAIDSLQRTEVDIRDSIIIWHKTCFSSFTSSNHLQRLKKRFETSLNNNLAVELTTPQKIISRSSLPPVEWDKCIYCQNVTKVKLHQVLNLETSEKIFNASKYDSILGYKLAGVIDLVAAKTKYHLQCHSSSMQKLHTASRSHVSTEKDSLFEFSPVCFDIVVKELEKGLHDGSIYSVKSVWDRYSTLVKEETDVICVSPDSNALKKFRENLASRLGNTIEFVSNTNKNESLLIVPSVTKATVIQTLKTNVADQCTRDVEDGLHNFYLKGESDDILRLIYKTSSIIKSDLKNCKGHTTYTGIDKDHVEEIIPQSLFLLLSLIIGENEDSQNYNRILSIAQDIIYVQSKGRILTPKHIGLGVALHHMTRSKQIVQLVNQAGHCISYEGIQKVDTSIAKYELSKYKENNNTITPSNLVHNKFTQFAVDNIDIIEDVLDGKGTFHATQCAAFQCGVNPDSSCNKDIGKSRSLGPSLPDDFHKILNSGYVVRQRPKPIFDIKIQQQWFKTEKYVLDQAKSRDIAWLLCRMEGPNQQHIPAWTGFNHLVSQSDTDVNSVGHMPILTAPADDMNTVYTLITRCKHISDSLSLSHTVITFDQALYYRAKEIIWLKHPELKSVIVRLGSFHTAMNFLKVIGQHMERSGLRDVWVESGVFGETSTINMLTGKSYNKAVRGHKLTLEALWRILWPKFIEWVDQVPEIKHAQLIIKELVQKLKNHDLNVEEEYEELVSLLYQILKEIDQFDESQKNKKTYKLWRQYMDMVFTLLAFIRADREGNWSLHLESFTKMLPLFHRYDHTNYARWGTIYLTEMRSLPDTAPEVNQEFQKGNFSIKRTKSNFSQIGPDQALEHINRVAKVSGGLIGITRNPAARDRWCLTLNEKSSISNATLRMFDIELQDVNNDWTHHDIGPARIARDEVDVKKLKHELERFHVFERATNDLFVISTSDVAPDNIADSLSSAEDLGLKRVEEFVTVRLQEKTIDFYSKLKHESPLTLANMYQVKVKTTGGKTKTIKADRDLLQRLLVASQGGRDVDMKSILTHELSPVPISLASIDQKLNKSHKADLADILTEELNLKGEIPKSNKRSCILVDGMALIQSITKPDGAKTFGDFADIFIAKVINNFSALTSRVDILFDRYMKSSIKSGSRDQRTGSIQPIRRVIDNRDIKLPHNWKRFISLPDNKENLVSFLSQELNMVRDRLPSNSELVIGGGYQNIMETSTTRERDVTHLMADHEEADTRIVLHANDALKEGFERIIINCRDTDVLVMLVSMLKKTSSEIWFRAGTAKNVRNIPVHKIGNISHMVRENLCSFHSLTGCDSTSQFKGKSKKTAWKTYLKYPHLLNGMGKSELSADTFKDVERFVSILYTGDDSVENINDVRYNLFVKGKSLDSLPPTRDALKQHVERANYQSYVWNRAMYPLQDLPDPATRGWKMDGSTLTPVLMTQESVPEKCHQLITCQCRRGCTFRCGCLSHKLYCVPGCCCGGVCHNQHSDPVDESD